MATLGNPCISLLQAVPSLENDMKIKVSGTNLRLPCRKAPSLKSKTGIFCTLSGDEAEQKATRNSAMTKSKDRMEDYNTAMKRMMRNPYEYHHDLDLLSWNEWRDIWMGIHGWIRAKPGPTHELVFELELGLWLAELGNIKLELGSLKARARARFVISFPARRISVKIFF
ncbi:hypothetical protein Cgig2_003710 [Carnegiea gigantea]|uniref:Uncharacterized protein n=1 Tax=Carnegiea gigantea TaxID=171969 RepID=A0A9Q1QIE1_9CARY|nr:hypothetical protein Cgig2_003710 [Carnegiea gigantea]